MTAERHGLLVPRPATQLSLKQLCRKTHEKCRIFKADLKMVFFGCLDTSARCSPSSNARIHNYLLINPSNKSHVLFLIKFQKVTLDPVHPSSANANWLMGETTRSTLTALHGLAPGFCSSSLRTCEPGARSASGAPAASPPLSPDASVALVPSPVSSLKIEKHLSKRSMLEEG